MPIPRVFHRQANSHPLSRRTEAFGPPAKTTSGSLSPVVRPRVTGSGPQAAELHSAATNSFGPKQEPATAILASGPVSAFSDADLLSSFVQSGNESAFAELYGRHKAEVYTYCLRMMAGDADRASDVFQEVFIKTFEKADQFRNGSNVAGWIFTIARNMCLNHIRNERPCDSLDGQTSRESSDRSLAPEYDEQQHFLRDKLEQALKMLPVEFREPFMLREFDGFTYREIALMTGATLGMTKVRIYRAKQRMRELLTPYLAE
jgi:RNA polymerase sigma-70 factor (ECF subfamily)